MSQNVIRRIIVSTAKAPGAIGPYNQVTKLQIEKLSSFSNVHFYISNLCLISHSREKEKESCQACIFEN